MGKGTGWERLQRILLRNTIEKPMLKKAKMGLRELVHFRGRLSSWAGKEI